MRFKIHFEMSGRKQVLPLNYQYPISAWIYKILAEADEEFTRILHDEGYLLENGKTFKLFTFSKLSFPKKTWKILPGTDRMQVWSRNVWLTVSFQLPEQCEKFVVGLFKEQKVFIGDKISGIQMEVANIEVIDVNIPESSTVKLKTISPIVMGLQTEKDKNEQYINPVHKEYKRLFLTNLVEKHKAAGNDYNDIDKLNFRIKKLYPKTELQTIKAFTPEETKVRGYHYEFELTAPKDIILTGLNAGFGSMNSVGFGYCEVVEGKIKDNR